VLALFILFRPKVPSPQRSPGTAGRASRGERVQHHGDRRQGKCRSQPVDRPHFKSGLGRCRLNAWIAGDSPDPLPVEIPPGNNEWAHAALFEGVHELPLQPAVILSALVDIIPTVLWRIHHQAALDQVVKKSVHDNPRALVKFMQEVLSPGDLLQSGCRVVRADHPQFGQICYLFPDRRRIRHYLSGYLPDSHNGIHGPKNGHSANDIFPCRPSPLRPRNHREQVLRVGYGVGNLGKLDLRQNSCHRVLLHRHVGPKHLPHFPRQVLPDPQRPFDLPRPAVRSGHGKLHRQAGYVLALDLPGPAHAGIGFDGNPRLFEPLEHPDLGHFVPARTQHVEQRKLRIGRVIPGKLGLPHKAVMLYVRVAVVRANGRTRQRFQLIPTVP